MKEFPNSYTLLYIQRVSQEIIEIVADKMKYKNKKNKRCDFAREFILTAPKINLKKEERGHRVLYIVLTLVGV
jgi:hypothetical protein